MNELNRLFNYNFESEKWDSAESESNKPPAPFLDGYAPMGNSIDSAELFMQGDEATLAVIGYDTPTSDERVVDALISDPAIPHLASGMLLEINVDDGLPYLARLIKGPYTQPNGIPSNHPLCVVPNVLGGEYMPTQHGRAELKLIGHITDENTIEPAFHRPPPISSKVKKIADNKLAELMNFQGSAIGSMIGPQSVQARYDEYALDQHTGIVGSTGAGKSITGARMVWNAAEAGTTAIFLDKEGDLAFANEPASDPGLSHLLEAEGLPTKGLDTILYVVSGRRSRNPDHPNIRQFSLAFSEISPHILAQLMNLNEAQLTRFWEAFDIAIKCMKKFNLLPASAPAIDESQLLDAGVPGMTFAMFRDIMAISTATVTGQAVPIATSLELTGREDEVAEICNQAKLSANPNSWKVVFGETSKLARLAIFDIPGAPPLDFDAMLKPSIVNIFDLSDTDELSLMNNLVISRMLRGVRLAQEKKYNEALKSDTPLDPVLIFLEEAHEFLSRDTIREMPEVFRQLRRTALRGRKRRLGLVITSQLPHRLPDDVIGLCNNWMIHKLTSEETIHRLKAVVGKVPDSYWNQVNSLTKGQAIAAFDQWEEPTLIKVLPPPFKVMKVR